MIRNGDILLDRGTKWIDKEIKKFEHNQYSHAAGIVNENEIIEADGIRQVGYNALDYYDNKADIFTCEVLTENQREEIVRYVKSKVGSHFDYALVLIEAVRYLFHIILPYKEKMNFRICSTLWADAYKHVGIDLCPGIKYPSPADLSQSKLLKKICSI